MKELIMDVHVYHHVEADTSVSRKLDKILTLLERLTAQGERIVMDITGLKAEVERETTVTQSAITLINGLSAQLAAAKTDPAAIQALADQLSAQSDALAAAVAANTPAA